MNFSLEKAEVRENLEKTKPNLSKKLFILEKKFLGAKWIDFERIRN